MGKRRGEGGREKGRARGEGKGREKGEGGRERAGEGRGGKGDGGREERIKGGRKGQTEGRRKGGREEQREREREGGMDRKGGVKERRGVYNSECSPHNYKILVTSSHMTVTHPISLHQLAHECKVLRAVYISMLHKLKVLLIHTALDLWRHRV